MSTLKIIYHLQTWTFKLDFKTENYILSYSVASDFHTLRVEYDVYDFLHINF